MKTVVLGDPPDVLVSLVAQRQRLGLDRHDEVWQGAYHMAPAASFEHADVTLRVVLLLEPFARTAGLVRSIEFNLGRPRNYRVPDLGFHRGSPQGLWCPTAAIVGEIRSPHDESYEKFAFYFDHGVDELLLVDLVTREVQWFRRGDAEFAADASSALLGVTGEWLKAALGW